jgi:hypothetical protein
MNKPEEILTAPCGYSEPLEFETDYTYIEQEESEKKKATNYSLFDVIFIKFCLIMGIVVVVLFINILSPDTAEKIIEIYKNKSDSTQIDFIENVNESLVEWIKNIGNAEIKTF